MLATTTTASAPPKTDRQRWPRCMPPSNAGTAAGLMLLAFAAGLALETMSAGRNLSKGLAALDLAARVGAEKYISPSVLCEA